jgi:hypothetical protein
MHVRKLGRFRVGRTSQRVVSRSRVCHGLAAKIVEFSRGQQLEGVSLFDAATKAARVQLRPSIMTSFAYIEGVRAGGVDAEMRRPLRTVVFSGLIGVMIVVVFPAAVFLYGVRVPVTTGKLFRPKCAMLDIDSVGFQLFQHDNQNSVFDN